MRLTADVLLRGEAYLNPLLDRELCLRGLKIPAIENLAVLQDQFDTIDFSDNEIKKLENFPKMIKLGTLLFCNNFISRIASLGEFLPTLHSLVLTNNRLSSLSDIDNLSSLKNLQNLSLVDNPVTHHPNYRLYVIARLPMLKSLDFKKVSVTERKESSKLMSSDTGKSLTKHIAEEKQRNIDQEDSEDSQKTIVSFMSGLSEKQLLEVRQAIEKASSRQEVDRIEYQIRSGTFQFSV